MTTTIDERSKKMAGGDPAGSAGGVEGKAPRGIDGSKQATMEQLTAEHRRLDEQLRMLERRRALTPAEQVEISRLKKQKLLTKERIARLRDAA